MNQERRKKTKNKLVGVNEKIQSAVLIKTFTGWSSQGERTQKDTNKNIHFFKECTHKRTEKRRFINMLCHLATPAYLLPCYCKTVTQP